MDVEEAVLEAGRHGVALAGLHGTASDRMDVALHACILGCVKTKWPYCVDGLVLSSANAVVICLSCLSICRFVVGTAGRGVQRSNGPGVGRCARAPHAAASSSLGATHPAQAPPS